MPSKQPSLYTRAVLALLLMIGFYLLAVAISAGLFYVACSGFSSPDTINIRIPLFCVIGGSLIIYSVIPRVDRFLPPGVQLHRDKHPLLFAELERVALAVNQPMPEEVYLVPDINAWVSRRGGVMGFGSRPVMGLGLPLLTLLKVSELKAVIAHEFGHYHGGDTKLAPWVWKTRGAITRTLANLEGSHFSMLRLLQVPFLGYGQMFLRITHSISRQQEYAADQLASKVVGVAPLVNGLRKTMCTSPVFNAYWENEVRPVMAAGYRPPLSDGFARFMKNAAAAKWIAERMAGDVEETRSNPFDTHPSLKERIHALGDFTDGFLADDRPALELMTEVGELEKMMVEVVFGANGKHKFTYISWSEAGEKVFLPLWKQNSEKYCHLLQGIRLRDLPVLAGDTKELLSRFEVVFLDQVSSDGRLQAVCGIIGCTIAVLLAREGWVISRQVGQTTVLVSNDARIKPFSLIQDLHEGVIPAGEWTNLCERLGISETVLCEVLPPEASPTQSMHDNNETTPKIAMEDVKTSPIWVEAAEGQPWACPKCGEINQPHYDVCYNCLDQVQRRVTSKA